MIYDLLFRCASQTLLEVAADPKHLGARLGILAILHTWSQTLLLHPHLHCIVPGGGPSLNGEHWVATAENFLLPVRVLSPVFRGKFLAGLKVLHQQGRLRLTGGAEELREPWVFHNLLDRLYQKFWWVYSKPPFGGPEQVLKYLARYTHRVALSNHRLVRLRRPSHLHPQGLFPRRPEPADDAAGRGIHPSLPAAHPAPSICAHPLLRAVDLSPSRTAVAEVPGSARCRRSGARA